MAVIPSIVQTAQGATSVGAPATVAPTWAATQAGSCLVFFLAGAMSAAGSASPPAGWILINATAATTLAELRLWILPNNAGGITGGTWTLTNYNGAAWGFYELAGVNAVTPQDRFSLAAASLAVGGSPLQLGGYFPHYTNEFWLDFAAIVPAAAVTPASTGGTLGWTAGPTATSTTGATNVTLASQHQLQGAGAQPAQASYTFAGSPAACIMQLCLYGTQSKQLALAPDGSFVTA